MTRYRWVRADGSLRGYIWATSRSAAYAMRRVRAGEFVTGEGERTAVAPYLAASRIVEDGHGYPVWTERDTVGAPPQQVMRRGHRSVPMFGRVSGDSGDSARHGKCSR